MTEDTNLFVESIEEQQQEPAADTHADGQNAAEPTVKCVFLGKEVELPLKEAILWAQKGMNAEYARERDGASKERELLDFFAAQNGMDRQAFMEHLEKNRLMALTRADLETIRRENPHLPEAVVRKTAELRAMKRLEDYEAQREHAEQQKKAEQARPWLKLLERFPEITCCSDLPEEALSAIDAGSTPLEAMLAVKLSAMEQELSALQAQLAAREKNRANEEKSLGSAVGYGEAVSADPFLMGMMNTRKRR